MLRSHTTSGSKVTLVNGFIGDQHVKYNRTHVILFPGIMIVTTYPSFTCGKNKLKEMLLAWDFYKKKVSTNLYIWTQKHRNITGDLLYEGQLLYFEDNISCIAYIYIYI